MNKLYSVVYSPKAKDDLKEIYTYIAFYTVDTRSRPLRLSVFFTEGRTLQILQRILKTYKLRLSTVDKISTPFYLKIGIDISLHAVGCCILGQK